jgi:hypothetical protein
MIVAQCSQALLGQDNHVDFKHTRVLITRLFVVSKKREEKKKITEKERICWEKRGVFFFFFLQWYC